MKIQLKIQSIKNLLSSHKKIIENYFFMTTLQVLNSFFYLIIYPFLIRTLGIESYGLFVFATSIATYFSYLINFGFDMPAVKTVAENSNDSKFVSKTLSSIFTAKMILFVGCLTILVILLLTLPVFKGHFNVYLICFLQVISFVLFPQWYFQAIQKMKIVTYIQLGIKILSLPFIFYFINSSKDLLAYIIIVTLSSVIGGIIAFFIVNINHKLKIRFVGFQELKVWFRDAFPFFLSTSAGIVKEQSIIVIIGAFFGMKEVAIYDLANKIIVVPRTIFLSVNAAIFPTLIKNIEKAKVSRIINIESIISLSVIVFIVILGKWIVEFMGGPEMLLAYPLSIFLSVTVMTWLVVGAYISFVFIPNNKYFLVSKNQLIALGSFAIYTAIGLLLYNNILVFGAAIMLSGLTEIIYCKVVTKKYNLL